MTGQYAAAWVPDDDPQRDWEDAASLAVDWIISEGRKQRATPLLVTPTQSQWNAGVESITRFARRYPATTPRSRRVAKSGGPVLAYVPDYESLYLASTYARGSSLAVVETIQFPLIGWAMELGALNLLTGEPTPDVRSDHQRAELERVNFYGNNGWTRGFGASQASRVLSDVLRQDHLSADVIVGTMLGKGHNGDAVERLRKLIGRVSPKGGESRVR